jgi:tetrahydromethanopterin:alpha-L-glutamate ligase
MTRAKVRFGVVTAWPDEDWHSQRLLRACAQLGIAVAIDPSEFNAFVGDGVVDVRAVNEAARSFHAFILARGLSPNGDADVQFEMYRALEGAGALVVNRIDALLTAQDKFRTSWLLRRAGLPTPHAAVAQTPRHAIEALERMKDVVVKPLAGSLGEGVERVRCDAAGRHAILSRLESEGAVYLQSYVPNAGRDLRIFVVGGKTRQAISRVAAPGEWVSNVARGGEALPAELSSAGCFAAERAAQVLGLDYTWKDPVARASSR